MVYKSVHTYEDAGEHWKEWLSDIAGIAAVLILLFLFFGCGGGSSGTGLNGSNGPLIEGLIVSPAGDPVSGVTVTVPETGDQTVSDSNGEFSVSVSEHVDDLSVELDGSGVETDIAVNDIPNSTTGIDIQVTVDPDTGGVSGTDVHLSENDTPTRESRSQVETKN